jgi:hypothetical protein
MNVNKKQGLYQIEIRKLWNVFKAQYNIVIRVVTQGKVRFIQMNVSKTVALITDVVVRTGSVAVDTKLHASRSQQNHLTWQHKERSEDSSERAPLQTWQRCSGDIEPRGKWGESFRGLEAHCLVTDFVNTIVNSGSPLTSQSSTYFLPFPRFYRHIDLSPFLPYLSMSSPNRAL